MTNPKDIGRRIELRRKELGLTLKDVADRACVSLSTISRYERGEFDRIKLPVIMAIANALHVSHDYIVCKIDSPFAEISPVALSSTPAEERLLSLFRQLNDEGQERLLTYADDLASSGKYIKTDPSRMDKNA